MLRYWQPRIVLDIRRQIDSKDEKQSAAGWQALRELHDPSAIGHWRRCFPKYRHDASLEVIKVIGRMNTPGGDRFAVAARSVVERDDVRLAACEQLRGQPPWAYVPRLICCSDAPAQTRFEVVGDRTSPFSRSRRAAGHQHQEEPSRETRVPLYIPNPNLANIVNAAAH